MVEIVVVLIPSFRNHPVMGDALGIRVRLRGVVTLDEREPGRREVP
jgi:hypothetical protein